MASAYRDETSQELALKVKNSFNLIYIYATLSCMEIKESIQ